MITKVQLLKCSIAQFTQYGSRHVTLDALASSLGISKKTIYIFFDNKEDLVTRKSRNAIKLALKRYKRNSYQQQ